ncbi:MAG: YggS family pyridoxal phosphate-dependent enzyme [Terriglobia bacterium]
MSSVKDNIARVQDRIAAACLRSGRQPEEVRLIAVTKTVDAARIREAYEAGLRDFGENRVQEAAAKRPALAGLEASWHLIGHLQSNKAKSAAELFDWIHSVDSIRLAERLNHSVDTNRAPLPILLEVNLAQEEAKSGVSEDEVESAIEGILPFDRLELRGLMMIPPASENAEVSRPWFRRLRRLAEEIRQMRATTRVAPTELSMGMSHDFEVAIEEGATLVRVGTAIFGERQT